MSVRLHLAPGLGALAELGASAPEELFEPARLATGARAELAAEAGGVCEWRVPLPGTPDGAGRFLEAPRGGGTGWLRVRVFRASFPAAVKLRLSAPPSASAAAREWNLACLLLAAGVACPEPVALVEQERGGGAFVDRSAVATRELAGFVPLARWLEASAEAPRRLALEALGRALGRLFASRVWLPRLALDDVRIESPASALEAAARADDCAAATLERVRSEGEVRGGLRERGLALRPLPGVAFAVASGRVLARYGERRKRRVLGRLQRELRARGVLDARASELLELALDPASEALGGSLG